MPAQEALRAAAALLHPGGLCTVLSVAAYPSSGGALGASGPLATSLREHASLPHHPWSHEASLILDRLGIEATLKVASGEPAAALVRAARNNAADLLILGHHGREARRPPVLGQVARRLIAGPPCSILVAGSRPIASFERVLVAFGATPPADSTIHAAVSLARHCGATLLLLQVASGQRDEIPAEPLAPADRRTRSRPPRPSNDGLALMWAVQTFQRLGVEPHVDVVRGAFAAALTTHAARLAADVVCTAVQPDAAHMDALYRDVGSAVLVPPLPPPPAG